MLVVDDDADVGESLGALLRLRGNVVRVVYDGAAALEVAERFEPDVILLDLGMPRVDGFGVYRLLRDSPKVGGARIIALTGRANAEDRERTRRAGFDDYLLKPISLDGLIARIDGRRL